MGAQPATPFRAYPSTRGPAKIFMYGDPGTMKTRRAMAMPKPLAIIDMEGGACDYQDLAKDGDLYLSTRSVAELEKALAWVEANAERVGTLIIDPITVLWQQLQQGHITRALKRGWIRFDSAKVPITEPEEVIFQIADWGKLKTHHAAIITRVMNLPCHVVMIARGMEKTNEKGEVKGYGWDGEKSLAFLAKVVIETRTKNDTVIKDRFTNQFKDGTKVDRVDLGVFVKAAGKGGVKLEREDEAAAVDAGQGESAVTAPLKAEPEKPSPRAEITSLLYALAEQRGVDMKKAGAGPAIIKAVFGKALSECSDKAIDDAIPKFRMPTGKLVDWFDDQLRTVNLLPKKAT